MQRSLVTSYELKDRARRNKLGAAFFAAGVLATTYLGLSAELGFVNSAEEVQLAHQLHRSHSGVIEGENFTTHGSFTPVQRKEAIQDLETSAATDIANSEAVLELGGISLVVTAALGTLTSAVGRERMLGETIARFKTDMNRAALGLDLTPGAPQDIVPPTQQ